LRGMKEILVPEKIHEFSEFFALFCPLKKVCAQTEGVTGAV